MAKELYQSISLWVRLYKIMLLKVLTRSLSFPHSIFLNRKQFIRKSEPFTVQRKPSLGYAFKTTCKSNSASLLYSYWNTHIIIQTQINHLLQASIH